MKAPLFVAGLALLLFLLIAHSAGAAEWQWNVTTELLDKSPGQAYLWIPPSCKRVRGLIVTDANMLERIALENPVVRQAAEKAGLGIVLFTPKTFSFFKYKEGADKILLKGLKDLAAVSGYQEIEHAPLLSLGNSASTPFAWYVGYWKPERTIATICLKGALFPAPDFDKGSEATDVPALAIVGEYYEWPTKDKSRLERWKADRDIGLNMRVKRHREMLAFFADVSRGHFDFTDDLAPILAMYITKAAAARLPADAPLDGPVTLRPVDPASGWLTDANTVLATHVPPAPYKDYTGDRTKAFWAFDKEMAETMDRYAADQKTKTYQMVTFTQDGKLLDDVEKGAVELRYAPGADESLIKLTGTYLEKRPAALPNQPELIGHSKVPVQFLGMGGPDVQLSPDTFRLRFDRYTASGPAVLEMLAYSPGDSQYRKAFQPAHITIPPNYQGKPQQITFQPISNLPAGTKETTLKATSNANLPVEFLVKYGPAEVEGNRLVLTGIPPRSKFPIKVVVTACQQGRIHPPQVQTAQPVEQIFLIEAPRGNR